MQAPMTPMGTVTKNQPSSPKSEIDILKQQAEARQQQLEQTKKV